MSERKLIEYFVEDNARFALNDLAQFLVKEYTNVNNLRFLNYCRLHAFKLPEELIKRIITFYRDEEGDGYIIIRKLALIDDIYIGDTPNNWKQGDVNPKSYYLDFILVLIIAIISEPVAYLEQRPDGGGIVHDVIPLLDDDVKQVGSGSSEELLLHTEDITLENSCDFTALLSVRNHEEALSSLSIFNEFKISDESKTILFGDNFIFPPDPNYEYEHQNKYYNKRKRPILFGNKLFPYIRIAPFDMLGKTEISSQAELALQELISQIETHKMFVLLNAGDLLLLNNKRVLHGRSSFITNYDATKRWMKRVLGLCDLMKASNYRDFSFPYLITEKSFWNASNPPRI